MELAFQNIYIGGFWNFPVLSVFCSTELPLQLLYMQTITVVILIILLANTGICVALWLHVISSAFNYAVVVK